MGDWYSWEHSSFASFSQRFDPAILHQLILCNGGGVAQRNGLQIRNTVSSNLTRCSIHRLAINHYCCIIDVTVRNN